MKKPVQDPGRLAPPAARVSAGDRTAAPRRGRGRAPARGARAADPRGDLDADGLRRDDRRVADHAPARRLDRRGDRPADAGGGPRRRPAAVPAGAAGAGLEGGAARRGLGRRRPDRRRPVARGDGLRDGGGALAGAGDAGTAGGRAGRAAAVRHRPGGGGAASALFQQHRHRGDHHADPDRAGAGPRSRRLDHRRPGGLHVDARLHPGDRESHERAAVLRRLLLHPGHGEGRRRDDRRGGGVCHNRGGRGSGPGGLESAPWNDAGARSSPAGMAADPRRRPFGRAPSGTASDDRRAGGTGGVMQMDSSNRPRPGRGLQ